MTVFDDHINTSLLSMVNAATTISGFLQGNNQILDCQSIQTVFSQVADFQILVLIPLTLAILNQTQDRLLGRAATVIGKE